ncbi:uncharacterized protein LOC122242572 [Penaeus japonicus]|uniref:uncharacterized protein LOC122242572 n=1 Tax=Penaeus japonicus TaxID=27405 RepID=UPI001C711BA2|nr:uncharacterized protein LOC122242572 [Penaeus japonicus]
MEPFTRSGPPAAGMAFASVIWLTLSSTIWITVLCSPSSVAFSSHLPPPSTSADAWPFSYYSSTTPTYGHPPAHVPLLPRDLDAHPNEVSRRLSSPPTAPFGHEAFHHHALHSSQDDPARHLPAAHALGSWPAQRPYALHHTEVVHDYAHTGPARPRHTHRSSDAPRSYAAFVLGGPRRPLTPAAQLGFFPPKAAGIPTPADRVTKAGRAKAREGTTAEKETSHDRELSLSVAARAEKQGKFYRKLKERNHAKSRLKFPSRSKKARHRIPEAVSVASHGRRSSGPHRGFLKTSYVPTCAINSNRSFCLLDESYPSAFMAEELELHYESIRDLWRPSEKPRAHNSSYTTSHMPARNARQEESMRGETKAKSTKRGRKEEEEEREGRRWSSKKEGGEGWSCPTRQQRARLSMARNTRGKWRLIVNVDGNPSLRQTTSIEECIREETSCDLLPTLVTSRCVQKYVVHNLLSWAPEEGFYVDSYSLPSACVCYISRVDLHLLYTFVKSWDIRQ